MKKSFIIYHDYEKHFDLLSNEELGILFKIIFKYEKNEKIDETLMTPIIKMAFSFVKANLDRDREKFDEVCHKRSEAGKLGGRPAKKANAFDEKAKKANGFSEKQTKAKKADNDTDNDNDTENENENENEKERIGASSSNGNESAEIRNGQAVLSGKPDSVSFFNFFEEGKQYFAEAYSEDISEKKARPLMLKSFKYWEGQNWNYRGRKVNWKNASRKAIEMYKDQIIDKEDEKNVYIDWSKWGKYAKNA